MFTHNKNDKKSKLIRFSFDSEKEERVEVQWPYQPTLIASLDDSLRVGVKLFLLLPKKGDITHKGAL